MCAATVTVSAPGSLMISGEHAVLHRRHALAGAVDQRIRVSLQPRGDDDIRIVSALGERRMSRAQIDSRPPFRFVGAAIERAVDCLPGGMDLLIESDFPADVGLGSSAAVTVATLAAMQTWVSGVLPEREALLAGAVSLIRAVQGRGSGADVAAAVYGGVVLYLASPPRVVERFGELPPITLFYAGYKTPTPEVVGMVEDRRQSNPDAFETIFDEMEAATMALADAMRRRDWAPLGAACAAGQKAMVSMGVCDPTLAEIVTAMEADAGILGAKVSGSGLGDCVLGIGRLAGEIEGYRSIPVTLSNDGVRIDSAGDSKRFA